MMAPGVIAHIGSKRVVADAVGTQQFLGRDGAVAQPRRGDAAHRADHSDDGAQILAGGVAAFLEPWKFTSGGSHGSAERRVHPASATLVWAFSTAQER